MRPILLFGTMAFAALVVRVGQAQQVTVTTPLVGVHDRYYEHINLGWGMHRHGPSGSWFLNFGGPMSALPPFGGYDPAGDFRFGYGSSGFGGGSHFQLSAGQGSSRSMTMVAPSVTMMNGARGSIFSGSMRPFVTGLIPVVGDYPVMVPYAEYPQFNYAPPTLVSPLAERIERLRAEGGAAASPRGSAPDESLVLDGGVADEPAPVVGATTSTAAHGDISVAEIRRLQAVEDAAAEQAILRLVEEAKVAESKKEWGVARVRYRQAAAQARGPARTMLLDAAAKLDAANLPARESAK